MHTTNSSYLCMQSSNTYPQMHPTLIIDVVLTATSDASISRWCVISVLHKELRVTRLAKEYNTSYNLLSTTKHSLIYFSANRPNNFTASLGSICMSLSEHDSVVSTVATTSDERSDDEDDDDNDGL